MPTRAPNPFSPDAMSRLIAETLPAAETHHVAIVGSVDQTGAQVVAGFTSTDGKWSASGAYRHDWTTGDNAGVATVIYKW